MLVRECMLQINSKKPDAGSGVLQPKHLAFLIANFDKPPIVGAATDIVLT